MKTWFYDLLKPIVRAYYFLVRGIRATGTENVASPGGYILCSNHVSASDPFVLATCVRRRLHFMAKAELFKNRIVGGFISAIGAFPIRRGESDLGAVRESIRLLNEGHVVGIFPQDAFNLKECCSSEGTAACAGGEGVNLREPF